MKAPRITNDFSPLISTLEAEHQPALAAMLDELHQHPALPLLAEATSRHLTHEIERMRKRTLTEISQISAAQLTDMTNAFHEACNEIKRLAQSTKQSAKIETEIRAAEARIGAKLETVQTRIIKVSIGLTIACAALTLAANLCLKMEAHQTEAATTSTQPVSNGEEH